MKAGEELEVAIRIGEHEFIVLILPLAGSELGFLRLRQHSVGGRPLNKTHIQEMGA